ncbi:MAG: bifunctional DNA-formamidopyrimidine glycosylase/DNA-(apurinic or apyrimidinic site) lyase [Anaerolineae bacterium]
MPELPEVETIARELRRDLVGRRIVDVEVRWERTIALPSAAEVKPLLVGRQIMGTDRRGKYLLFPLSGGQTLVIHLRMTGQLHVVGPEATPDKHTHLVLTLDSGRRLFFRDMRKFGRVYVVADVATILRQLGPEPLNPDLTPQQLAARLAGRKAPIKSLLLDQRVVAGIGNIYADEILFAASIDPRRPGGDLQMNEIARIHTVTRRVLAQAIFDHGSSLQNYQRPGGAKGQNQERHQVFRRTGKPCARCGTAIVRVVIGQRATHFCPQCQR